MSPKRTFINAFRGLWHFLRTESNNRFHLPAALLAILAGWYFHIALTEWLFIATAIGIVLAAEAFNASLEKLCDAVKPEQNERVKNTKDMAAGAVLISAIVALTIGLIIFVPKLLSLFV